MPRDCGEAAQDDADHRHADEGGGDAGVSLEASRERRSRRMHRMVRSTIQRSGNTWRRCLSQRCIMIPASWMSELFGDWCRGWRRGSVLAVGSRGWAMGAAVPLRTDIEVVALGRLARQESGRR
jgi:hypothetical protein